MVLAALFLKTINFRIILINGKNDRCPIELTSYSNLTLKKPRDFFFLKKNIFIAMVLGHFYMYKLITKTIHCDGHPDGRKKSYDKGFILTTLVTEPLHKTC